MATAANPTAALDDIVQRLADIYPPRGARESRSMSENGNAYVPRSEFDFFQREFHDLKTETSAQFNRVEGKIDASHAALMSRLDTFQTSGGSGFEGMVKWALPIIVVLGTAIGTLVKMNIDTNVTDVRDSQTQVAKGLATSIETVDRNLASKIETVAGNVTALMQTTIPRPELDFRIGANREAVQRAQSELVPRTEFEKRFDTVRDDIAALKENTLKREDLDARFSDYRQRLDLVSNRVEELQRSSAGTAVLQEQVHELASQLVELRSRLLFSPGYLVPSGDSKIGRPQP